MRAPVRKIARALGQGFHLHRIFLRPLVSFRKGLRKRGNDQTFKIRPISPLLTQSQSAHGEAPKSRHVPNAAGGRKARARGPIFQTTLIAHEANKEPGTKPKADEETLLVWLRYEAQQCARSGIQGLYLQKPAGNRSFSQTIRRGQPQAQRQSVSIGDVDAEFLHQSRRQKFVSQTKGCPGTSQAGIAQGVRTGTITHRPKPSR